MASDNLTSHGGQGFDQLSAALVAGQLLQRFRFQIQQAVFFNGQHKADAAKAGAALARVVRHAVPVPVRDALEKEVSQRTSCLLQPIGEQWLAEELWEANDELRANYPQTDSSLVREELLGPLFWGVDQIRNLITDALAAQSKLAFRLGEAIAEGLYRPDVHRFLWEEEDAPQETENNLSSCEAASLSTVVGAPTQICHRWLGQTQACCHPANLLVNRSPEPGEIPPDESWLECVKGLWAELKLPTNLLTGLPTHPEELSAGDRLDLVKELDCKVREALAGLASTTAASSQPPAEPDFRFELVGEIWHLRYSENGQIETGDYPRQGYKGLSYYHHLLAGHNRDVSAVLLQRRMGSPLPAEHVTRYELLDQEGSEDADSEEGETKVLSQIGFSIHDQLDMNALRDLKQAIESAKEQIAEAKELNDDDAQLEAERDLDKLLTQLKRDMKRGKVSKHFVSDLPQEKARKAVGSGMRSAATELPQTCPC